MGWTVNWDQPNIRPEWYHNMSSVLQAGPCVRSNQLDYDEDVMYKVSEHSGIATVVRCTLPSSYYCLANLIHSHHNGSMTMPVETLLSDVHLQ
jgi:choline-sulfatase